MTTAPTVLLVDLQYDFFDPRSAVGNPAKGFCLPAVRRIVVHARSRGWPILHVITEHEDTTSLPGHLRRREATAYAVRDTPGARVVQGLVDEKDRLLRKTKYSAFSATGCTAALAGVERVIIAGIASDCCILHTAFDAEANGKQVFIPLEAVSGSNETLHVAAMEILEKSVATIISLSTILEHEPDHWRALADVAQASWAWYQRSTSLSAAAAASYDDLSARSGVDVMLDALERAIAP